MLSRERLALPAILTSLVLLYFLLYGCAPEPASGQPKGYIHLYPITTPPVILAEGTPYPTPENCRPPFLRTFDDNAARQPEIHHWVFVPPSGMPVPGFGTALFVQFQGTQVSFFNGTGLEADQPAGLYNEETAYFGAPNDNGQFVLGAVDFFRCGESTGFIDVRDGPIFAPEQSAPPDTPVSSLPQAKELTEKH